MDISLNDIGTIVSFVVPGYIAIRAYSLVYTKADKEFSKVLVESIAFSLPMIGIYNVVWQHMILHGHVDKTLYPVSLKYSLPLIIGSAIVSYTWARIRKGEYIKNYPSLLKIKNFLNLPSPSDDFIQEQLEKLGGNEYVTVTLRNGEIFSGVRAKLSVYRKDESQMCYFNYFAWYNKHDNSWDERAGSLILGMNDILYIETDRILPD